MASTSDLNISPTNSSFFSAEQVTRLNQTPPRHPVAPSEPSNGNAATAIDCDYVRQTLNEVIGHGMWSLKHRLTAHETRELGAADVPTSPHRERNTTAAMTAIVETILVIHSNLGPRHELTYQTTTVAQSKTGPNTDPTEALAAAIADAEAAGLKRCAVNLGTLFGLGHPHEQCSNLQPQAPAPRANGRAQGSKPAIPPSHRQRNKEDSAPASAKPTPQVGLQHPNSDPPTNAPITPPVPTVQVKKLPDWELSMLPKTYDEWLQCIQTIANRINNMIDDRELRNFARRYRHIIQKLPVLPATEHQKERNFKLRWNTIVSKRYNEFQLPVPQELLQPIETQTARAA